MQTVEALAERLRNNPADHDALQALKALYRRQGDYGSLANLIAGWAAWVGDDRAAAEAYVELGDVLAQHLADSAQAEGFYLEALRRDALSLPACDALFALWESQAEFERISEFFEAQLPSLAQHGVPPKQLAVFRYRLGELKAKQQAPAQALQQYRRALELDPTLLRAIYEARQLLLQLGDLRGATEMYERETAAEADGERKIALLSELAALYRDELHDFDGAVSALQRAHGLAPEDPGLSYELATLLLQRAEHADEHTRTGDYAQVAQLLFVVAAQVEPEQAVSYLETALGYAPDHEAALAALEQILEGSDDARLAAHWVAYIASAPRGGPALRRRVKLARAYAAQGQLADAIYCLGPAAEGGLPAAIELLGQLEARAEGAPPKSAAPQRRSARANPSEPAARPRSNAPEREAARRARHERVTRPALDAADVNTVVGEPDLIESLREATVEVELVSAEKERARMGDSAPPLGDDMLLEDLDAAEESASPLPASLATPVPLAAASFDELAPEEAAPFAFEREREFAPEAPVPAAPPLPASPSISATERDTLRRDANELARARREDEAAAVFEQVLAADPLDREAFAFLDGFYRRKHDHRSRAQLLETSAAAEALPARLRINRLREAASSYETRLKDHDAAIRALNALARLDPEGDDTLRTLKRLLERAERWDELVPVLETEVARAEQAEAKLPLLRRLAQLQREKRHDRAAAADVLERMLALRPDDRAAREALSEDLFALERYDEIVPLIERKYEEAATKAQKLALLRQLATLQRERLHDFEQALRVYERAFTLAPGDSETLAQLLVLEGQPALDHRRLLAILERQVQAVDGPRGAELLVTMARIAKDRLDDLEQSGEFLARAVDLAPDRPEYLEALCALYENDARFDDLVELLRERALIERNPTARVELLRRIARVLEERLSNPSGAQAAWEQLLQMREDREALAALRKRASERDDAEALAKLLGRLAALETDARERCDLLFERARLLAERLARPAEAVPELLRILNELDPGFESAFALLCEAAAAANDYRGLSQVLEQRLGSASASEARAMYAQQLAEIYEHKLVDPERATVALEAWSNADPTDPQPQRRLCPLLARARRHEALLDTLDALARLEPDARARERALIQAAELAAGKLHDPDSALERLTPLVNAGARAAIEAAVTLARSGQRMPALYDLLEHAGQIDRLLALLREASSGDQAAPARAVLMRRTAQVLIEYKQDEAAAADVYRQLLTIEEDLDALRFLQSIALREDDPATLADVLKRLAALEPAADERRELLFEHARLLCARLDRPADAITVLQALLAEDASFEPGWEELLRAAELAADHKTLADTLERMLARSTEPDARAQFAARLADVCERELRDATRAVAALKLWSAAAPAQPEPLRRLRPQLEAAGQNHDLLAVLDALATTEPDAEARIEATLAAATLARNQLDDIEGAWQRLVPRLAAADPRIDRALFTLANDAGRQPELYQLLEQSGRYRTLVEWLEQRISLERDDENKAELFRRMARTLLGPLADEQGAADAWSRLLRVHEDAEALAFMRARALQADDMPALCDCLLRLALLEQDATEKRDLLYEYGHLLRSRLQRPADAVPVLREVVAQLDPDFEPAIDELIQASEAVGETATLAWALEHALARESDAIARAELAQRLARLYSEELKQPERALAALTLWTQAAPADPEPLRQLIALLRGTARHAELIAALDALALHDEDPAARERCTFEAAKLAFEQLADPDGAFLRLEPLASAGHSDAEALIGRIAFESGRTDALVAFYEQRQRFDDLLTVLRTMAERSTDKHARAELYLRCARLLIQPLADPLGAIEAYREVLNLEENEEALRFLRQEAQDIDDPAELSEVLRRLAGLVEPKDQRRDLLFERALLLSDRLDQREEASAILSGILNDIDPSFAPAIEELIAIAEADDDYPALALGLERQLALARSREERADLSERLADLYESKLRDAENMLVALRSWSEAAPLDPEPLRRMRPELERASAFTQLLAMLDALATRERQPEARNEAVLAAASLASSKLGDHEGAWLRISPLMLAGDERAEHATHELAAQTGQYRPLVNLYVLRAQQPRGPEATLRDWHSAAKLYEQRLNEPLEALEALLRALALDMKNHGLLDAIDRLAIASSAWERLFRVYNRLVQETQDRSEKVELLARNATLLEQRAANPSAALERVLQACRLAPERDDLLERAETLATQLESHAELVSIYEALAQNAPNDERRARHLLRAARVADLGMKDREHASRNLAQALGLSEHVPGLGAELEDLARELDRQRPELGKHDARRALIQAHVELAQQRGEPFGPSLVLRAAQLLHVELADDAASFDVLKQGATLFPNDLELYDALERAALNIKRLDALDAHVARCIQRADAFEVKRALLLRRGKLLADHLKRHSKAAEVYRELLALDPDNATAFDALVRNLRQAGNYQELLRVYTDRLERTEVLDVRLGLMREMALLWEVELRNRPSAVELWRTVSTLAPDDQEALAALSRLGQS